MEKADGGLSPSITPFGKRKFLGLWDQQYTKYIFCQYKDEMLKIIFFSVNLS